MAEIVSIAALAAELGTDEQTVRRCLVELRIDSFVFRPTLVSHPVAESVRRRLPQLIARDEERLTTAEVARMLRVEPATIRQWVRRGHLTPVDNRGRQNLYRRADARRARDAVARRTPSTGAFVRDEDLDKLVPTRLAARIARVSESTIRMWVHRGHLRPVGRHRRRLVFTVRDVVDAANR